MEMAFSYGSKADGGVIRWWGTGHKGRQNDATISMCFGDCANVGGSRRQFFNRGIYRLMRGLTDFLGSYTVSREITDHRSGAESRFEGTAEIDRAADGAIYRETGQLIMNDQQFQAERSYLWQQNGPRIEVLFHDGRPFHDFDPQIGGQATQHLCGQDMYRGGYDLSQWSCWAVTWKVAGPRKDYQSITWYVRR